MNGFNGFNGFTVYWCRLSNLVCICILWFIRSGWHSTPSFPTDLARRAFIACRGLRISMKNWDKWSTSSRPLGTCIDTAVSKALLYWKQSLNPTQSRRVVHLCSWTVCITFQGIFLWIIRVNKQIKLPSHCGHELRTKLVHLLAARHENGWRAPWKWFQTRERLGVSSFRKGQESRDWFFAMLSELLPGNVMDFRKFCVKGITYGQAWCRGCDEDRNRSNVQVDRCPVCTLVTHWSLSRCHGVPVRNDEGSCSVPGHDGDQETGHGLSLLRFLRFCLHVVNIWSIFGQSGHVGSGRLAPDPWLEWLDPHR